jgi:hypothetical protein
VSWKNAQQTADAWIAEHMPQDLRGRVAQLVEFPDDETCRIFYADRDLGFHRMVTKVIARIARKRGAAEIRRVKVTRENVPPGGAESAREFVESCHRFF